MGIGLRKPSHTSVFVSFLCVLLTSVLLMVAAGCGSSAFYEGVSINMAPGSASLNVNGTQQFSAMVTGNSNTAITWTVSCSAGASCGTVSPTGLYTAPASISAASTATVKATANADNSKIATASVSLVPITISAISPGTASLNVGGTQQFTATVSGSTKNNAAVAWTVLCSGGSNCGTISAAGLYTAPASISVAGAVTVTATASADSSKTATASISLLPITISAVTPGTASLNSGQTQQFTATVTGSANTAVAWTLSC
jgi:hypothetical protein